MSDPYLPVTRRRTLQAMAGAMAALALPEGYAAQTAAAQEPKRSEERRVGKEC